MNSRTLKVFLNIVILLNLSACFQGAGELKFNPSNLSVSTSSIESPVNLQIIPASELSAITVSGTCSATSEITLNVLDQEVVTPCLAGSFSSTIDASDWVSGNLLLTSKTADSTHAVILRVDAEGPVVSASSPLNPLTQFGEDFDFSWTGADALSGLRETQTYFVEVFTNGSCIGVPFSDGFQDNPDLTLSPMVNGSTYSLRVRAFDEHDNEGSVNCLPSVTVNQTVPTLSLSDATTGSTDFIRQVSTVASITNSSVVTRWCLSESASAEPAVTDTCFTTTKPGTLTFSTGDGAKTAYLWVADSAGTVLSAGTDAITLDTTLPATPTVSLTGDESASTSYTNDATNDLSITGDTDGVLWCIKELTSAATAPAKPAYDDSCFTSPRPASYILTGRGSRKIYVFTVDEAGNVSDAGSTTFAFPLPSAATISGPAKIFTNECTPAITIEARDENGLLSPAATALTFTLTDSGTGGSFYSDPGCLTSVTSATIAAGMKNITTYFKATTAGARTLSATSGVITQTHNLLVTAPNLVTPGRNGMTCATLDGAAYCWGNNSGTTFGDNVYESSRSQLSAIPGLSSGVTMIEAGEDHACAIQNGSAKCWGQSWGGQVGVGSSASQPTVVTPTGLADGVTSITAGLHFTCAVRNGGAYCFGWNSYGQLGLGTTTDVLVPTLIPSLSSGVTKIDSGTHFACAIQNGGVKCWGNNGGGAVGDGTNTNRHVPTQVSGLESGVTDLALGDFHACALQNGIVKCWGGGWSGQLGTGASASSNVPLTNTTLPADVTDIEAAFASSCAVAAGELWCWGVDTHGQRGDGTANNWSGYTVVKVPSVTGFENLRMALYTSCAIFSGTPKCWGSNLRGELGTGELEASQLPLAAAGISGTPVALSTGNTSCVVRSTGTIQCWGAGDNGQVGDGGILHRNSPSSVFGVASGATSVSTGPASACAVISGGVKCWGKNDYGELGISDWRLDAPGAAVIASGSGATDVSVSITGSNVCAVVSGEVRCWGRGSSIPATVSGISGAIKVATTEVHACALTSAGAVICWGTNTSAQIGTGATSASEAPFEVITTGATDISVGTNFSCAVVSANLQCWGVSAYGETGYSGYKLSPFQITSLDGTVSKVRSGTEHTCIVTTSGTVKCFGRNNDRQLGNTAGATAIPQTVPNLSSVTELSLGKVNACAISSNIVKCWGFNTSGSFSDGASLLSATPVEINLPASQRTATITAPASVTVSTCSNAFTVTVDAAVTTANTIKLAASDGAFYPASSNCDVAAITSVTIPVGSTGVQFKYRATTSGGKNISAKGLKTSRALATYTVTP